MSVGSAGEWHRAELSKPLPGDDVWRQWRFAYDREDGHLTTVRAIDGKRAVQERGSMDPFPAGADGWVSQAIEPSPS